MYKCAFVLNTIVFCQTQIKDFTWVILGQAPSIVSCGNQSHTVAISCEEMPNLLTLGQQLCFYVLFNSQDHIGPGPHLPLGVDPTAELKA